MPVIKKENKVMRFINNCVFSDTVFAFLLLLLTLFTSIPLYQYKLAGLHKYLLAYGVLIILWRVFTKEIFHCLKKNTANILFALFYISYLVTILINRDIYLVDNLKQAAYMLTLFCVLFLLPQRKSHSELENYIKTLSSLVLVFTFLAGVFGIWSYATEFYYEYPSEYVETYTNYLGYYADTLYGLFHKNTCGTLSAVSVFVSIAFVVDSFKTLIVKNKDIKRKVVSLFVWTLAFANVPVQLLNLYLSSSRGGQYSFVGTIALIALLLLVRLIFSKVKKAREVNAKATLPLAAYFSLPYKNEINIIFTGRGFMWEAAINVFLEHPLFGVTRLGLTDEIIEYFVIIGMEPYLGTDVLVGGIHNSYLMILSSSGAIGFLLFAAFIIVAIYTLIKRIIKSDITPWFVLSSALFVFILMGEMVEARLIYDITSINILFLIYSGCIAAFAGKGLKSD